MEAEQVVWKEIGRCKICGRRLRDDISVQRGTGPGCWRKQNPTVIRKRRCDGAECADPNQLELFA